MEKIRKERILILAKTYPSPSAQYVETSCVAGISQDGAMRRLFPVPFRMIEDGQQFRKWQWIDVRVEKAPKDHRPESHKIYVDTINCGDVIDTKKAWSGRWEWLEKIPAFDSYDAIDDGHTGCLVPAVLLGLLFSLPLLLFVLALLLLLAFGLGLPVSVASALSCISWPVSTP